MIIAILVSCIIINVIALALCKAAKNGDKVAERKNEST
jgi:hypothetical protein